MFGLSEGYEQLWKAIIRPPRAEYDIQSLGANEYKRGGVRILRTDYQLKNPRGHKLQCSHYEPVKRVAAVLPCVIYLHGNSSCRLEGHRYASLLLSRNITLFTFDFSGCGLSEGEYISLGYYQRQDVESVFKFLRTLNTVSSIGIWGRSMGAVTALMYADSNHEIGCLVLDSPFSNLEVLSRELAQKHGGGFSFFSGIALSFLKSTIKEKNNFSIQDLDPIGNHVGKAYIPAFFIHGLQDDFILPHHTEDLHKAYSGEKKMRLVEGDHNSERPEEILEQVATFFYYGLCVQDLVKEDRGFMEERERKRKEERREREEREKGKGKEEKEEGEVVGEAHDFELQEEEEMARAIALSLSLQDPPKKQ